MSDIDGTGPGTGSEHAGRVPAAPAGPSRPGRLGVGIISAGRVGAVLGCALRAVEHQVVGVHAVSEESRERTEMLLPGVPVLEVEEIVERAELVLLAVPDDALEPLVQGLADLGRWQPGQLVAHTSGRYGAAVSRGPSVAAPSSTPAAASTRTACVTTVSRWLAPWARAAW